MTLMYRRPLRAFAVASLFFATPPVLRAQGTPRLLSLDEAMSLAEQRSEGVRIAQASVMRARGQQYQARSQFLPQLYGSVAVTRTIQSQFNEISERGVEFLRANPPADTLRPICTVNRPIPRGATPAERDAALQTSTTEGCGGGGLEDSPIAQIFAAEQTVTLGLQGSINLFTGGRVVASNRIAAAARRSAEIGLVSARASLALEVTQAYYDAALADRLATIADSSLQQSDRTLAQVTVARNVGNTSEFELLRAQVTRDNQRPFTIQRRTQRDLALLRLKQLIDLPASDSLVLTSTLSDSTLAPGGPADTRLVLQTMAALSPSTPADTAAEARASVRQLAELVKVQENALRIARAQRIPSLVLSTQYGRTAYPTSGIPSLHDFFPNWTVTAQLQVPLFTGGRITGDEMVARANLIEARENYQQVKELAALDARSALAELEQAVSAWAASQGTAGQAARAYRIAEVRYQEGISTQLELSQSRLLLQEAEANRAYAARNLRVAQSRLTLLRDLPLGAVQGGTQGNARQQAGAASAAGFNQTTPQGQSAGGAQTTNSTTSFGGQQP